MSGFSINFSFGDFPELVHQLRREVVQLLEEQADAEANPAVARRLREIAADFEAGLRLPRDWEDDLG